VNDLPVILKLAGKRCLVVGGGKVALRRAESLVSVGAKVTVVAPVCDAQLLAMDSVVCEQRAFVDSDLDDTFLVIIATDDKTVNDHVNTLANVRNVLVNRVDDPAAGDISIPAHAHCGPVTVAVHTNRISASAAAAIRDSLLDHIDPAWPALLSAMAPYRDELQQKVSDTVVRQKLLKQMAGEQGLDIIKTQGVMRYIQFCDSLLSEVGIKTSGQDVTQPQAGSPNA
jgi:siroheme synthase-like protein